MWPWKEPCVPMAIELSFLFSSLRCFPAQPVELLGVSWVSLLDTPCHLVSEVSQFIPAAITKSIDCGLSTREIYFSQTWTLEVWDRSISVSGVWWELSSSGMGVLLLCPYLTEVVREPSGVSLIRTPILCCCSVTQLSPTQLCPVVRPHRL